MRIKTVLATSVEMQDTSEHTKHEVVAGEPDLITDNSVSKSL